MKRSRRQQAAIAISKRKKGGKTARKGSVLSFKSWCLDESTRPATVVRKSEKAYSEMSEAERIDFCPPAKKVSSSPPADPVTSSEPISAPASNPVSPSPSPGTRRQQIDSILAARTRTGPTPESEKIRLGLISSNEKGWTGVHKIVPKSGTRKRGTRRRKTHRRRR